MFEFVFYVIAFIAGAFIYRLGIKDGMNVKQEKELESLIPKIDFPEIKNAFFEKKEEEKFDLFAQGLENIMSYNGEPQKKTNDI